MSIVGCILIAIFAQSWRSTLIAALSIGLVGSAFFGLLRSEEIRDVSLPLYVALGTPAFVAETAAFFAVKLCIRALWNRARSDEGKPKEESANVGKP